jgi:hypothetical protein
MLGTALTMRSARFREGFAKYVRLADELEATECDLVKEVCGYFAADPNVDRQADHIAELSCEEALRISFCLSEPQQKSRKVLLRTKPIWGSSMPDIGRSTPSRADIHAEIWNMISTHHNYKLSFEREASQNFLDNDLVQRLITRVNYMGLLNAFNREGVCAGSFPSWLFT